MPTTASSRWVRLGNLSAISMSFILVSLIITIVDATFNMHYLIHQVLDREDAGAERECKNAKQPPCPFLPAELFRVYYCWTLIHIILITVAANTNKWSWQTDDDLDVLSHTAVFFLACTIYLLLVVAVLTRLAAYGCISEHKPPKLVFSIILAIGLIISHISCAVATLFVLFSNEPGLDCLSCIALGFSVVVYVFLSLSFCLLSNWVTKDAQLENDNHRYRYYAAGITTLTLLVVLSIGALAACISSVQLSMNPLKLLSLLLFSLPLISWLVLLGFLIYLRMNSGSAENTSSATSSLLEERPQDTQHSETTAL